MGLMTLLSGDTSNPLDLPTYSQPDASEGWRAIGSAIGDVVDYGLNVQRQIYDIQAKADDASFNRFMQSVQLDTARSIASSQGETAKVQAQAALSAAQRQLNNTPNLTGISNAIGGSNKLMIALAIAGVVIAVMQLKK